MAARCPLPLLLAGRHPAHPRDAADDDDLGGAYWALLTHPATSEALADEALAHVHMLSHRAAPALGRIRRENQRLRQTVTELERSGQRYRTARDELAVRVRQLERDAQAIVRSAHSAADARDRPDGGCTASTADLDRLRARAEQAEEEARSCRRRLRESERRLQALEQRSSASGTARPQATIEHAPADAPWPPCDLAGRVITYVGGRGHVVPRLRTLAEQCNGSLVHHDGGLHERPGRLEDRVAAADVLIVALDCVSHDASRRLKRACRRLDKRVVWAPTSSVSAFEDALRRVDELPGRG